MESKEQKEARLAELRNSLGTVEGTPTEVYSRIVGYYRSVRNWNAGKREEFGKRVEYSFDGAVERAPFMAAMVASDDGVARTSGAGQEVSAALVASYLLFTRKACPNCPPVREYLSGAPIRGVVVDTDSDEGLALARKHDVLATPTAILLDSVGGEVGRAVSRDRLRAMLEPVGAGRPGQTGKATGKVGSASGTQAPVSGGTRRFVAAV